VVFLGGVFFFGGGGVLWGGFVFLLWGFGFLCVGLLGGLVGGGGWGGFPFFFKPGLFGLFLCHIRSRKQCSSVNSFNRGYGGPSLPLFRAHGVPFFSVTVGIFPLLLPFFRPFHLPKVRGQVTLTRGSFTAYGLATVLFLCSSPFSLVSQVGLLMDGPRPARGISTSLLVTCFDTCLGATDCYTFFSRLL